MTDCKLFCTVNGNFSSVTSSIFAGDGDGDGDDNDNDDRGGENIEGAAASGCWLHDIV
jgi:hypothetical protein